MKSLLQYKVLTFDCYGTLIDWERGLKAALGLADDEKADQQLARFADIETDEQRLAPTLRYSELLKRVYVRLAESEDDSANSASTDEACRFGDSVPSWPAFPDSAAALAYLKQHYLLVVLSNVDKKSFEGSQKRLGVSFDAVYTAEEIGSYKPALQNFEFLIDHLRQDFGLEAADILHVAQSLYHDHGPANRIGLDSAFIDRRHDRSGYGATRPPDAGVHYEFRFESMAALADAHRNALGDKLAQTT